MYSPEINEKIEQLKNNALVLTKVQIKKKYLKFIETDINKDHLYSPDELLSMAADKGNLELVTFFIEQIEYNQDHYATALYISVYKGNTEVVDFLLKNGAKINNWESILFIYSISFGFVEVVKLLVKYGMNINVIHSYEFGFRDETGCKKMFYGGRKSDLIVLILPTIRKGDLKMVKYLIELNRRNIYADNGKVLYESLANNKENMVNYFLTFYTEEQIEMYIYQNPDNKIFSFMKNNNFSYPKLINACRRAGIDIYDMIEKES